LRFNESSRPAQGRFGFGDEAAHDLGHRQDFLDCARRLPGCHYRRARRAKAEGTVERGSPNTASPARDSAVKRAMLAIEVHRHCSSPTLDRHGIYGGLGLAAADRTHQQSARIGDLF
jgi:hypothetical protein